MHPVFANSFRNLRAEIEQFDTTSASVHPWGRPHCWSVQQIVEHLTLSMEQTQLALEERLMKGRPERRSIRSRAEWLLQLMILSAGHMPKGVGSPDETTPGQRLPAMGVHELLRRLEAATEALDATFDRSRKRFGMERVGRHFLLGPLRIDQWRRYHALHMKHHARQVAEVRETLSVEVVHAPQMARV